MAEPAPDEFKDDGCTGVPDKPFRPCRRQHDWEYHLGGVEADRPSESEKGKRVKGKLLGYNGTQYCSSRTQEGT